MAFVAGITRSNYDTVGQQRLADAQSQLQSGIQNGADTETLLKLQKLVDDLKNTINARETARQKYLEKFNATEKRVREAQFEEVKRKFDENIQASKESVEERKNSIKAFSEKVGDVFDKTFDSIAHTLLGPLNLIVNPLEKALGINIFKIAKKPVADFLEAKFPVQYEKLKNNGGLIGAVGVSIIDAIHGQEKHFDKLLGEDDSFNMNNLLAKGGLTIGSILKGAGIVGLVVAGIIGIVNAWKNEWDTDGLNSAQDLKDTLSDETASTWTKIKAVGVYGVKLIFGSVVGGLKGFWDSLKSSMDSIFDIWNDPKKPVFTKIWDTVKTVILGIPQAIWNGVKGLISTLGDYFFGLWGEDSEVWTWWTNLKDSLSSLIDDIFGGLKDFFSWDNIKDEWAKLTADPLKYFQNLFSDIRNTVHTVFNKIIGAILGIDDFEIYDVGIVKFIRDVWIGIMEIIDPLHLFHDKPTHEVDHAASATAADENFNSEATQAAIDEAYFGSPIPEEDQDPNVDASEYMNLGDFKNWYSQNNPSASPKEIMDAWKQTKAYAAQLEKLDQQNQQNIHTIKDAIISKDNDLYIPSPDDNIVVTKSNVGVSSTQVSTSFQQELMTVLREIADKLKSPAVINNMEASKAVDFGGLRL